MKDRSLTTISMQKLIRPSPSLLPKDNPGYATDVLLHAVLQDFRGYNNILRFCRLRRNGGGEYGDVTRRKRNGEYTNKNEINFDINFCVRGFFF